MNETTKGQMLIVDDNDINRLILAEIFSDSYEILEAGDGREAIEILSEEQDKIDVMLLDLFMPEISGIEVLKWLKAKSWLESIPVFVVTAGNSDEIMRECFELGADDIIQKPVVPYFIRRRVDNIAELYETRKNLRKTVALQSDELLQKAQEINNLNLTLIEGLASAIESRDEESGDHVNRLGIFAKFFLRKLNETGKYHFSDEEIQYIAEASIMHDIGKIAIPDAILKKPGRLTPEEFEIMKTHSFRGWELLKKIYGESSYPVFPYALDICLHHHERYDGNGYPDKLKGDEISIWAQVVSLADVYDALTSDRIYKKAAPHERALEMIVGNQCGVFNPLLMDVLQKSEAQLKTLMNKERKF